MLACPNKSYQDTKPAAAKALQSCPTLCDPIDGSPRGSPVPGILQARTREWVAISSSSVWKWKVKVKSLSRVWLLATPWTVAYQAPPSMGFSRQEHWSGVPLPSLTLSLGSHITTTGLMLFYMKYRKFYFHIWNIQHFQLWHIENYISYMKFAPIFSFMKYRKLSHTKYAPIYSPMRYRKLSIHIGNMHLYFHLWNTENSIFIYEIYMYFPLWNIFSSMKYASIFSSMKYRKLFLCMTSVSSVTQSCPTLQPHEPQHARPPCPSPTPTQIHVHWVGDSIQPSHPLSSPFPHALNFPQHQGLFQWVSSLHRVAKVLEFQLQHQSCQWTPRTGLL